MTCKEFYDLNASDGQAVVLEGHHPITDTHISLSIVFSEKEGWGTRTEEDTVLDHQLPDRALLTEAIDWLTANFEDFERKEGIDFSAFYDDIVGQVVTTCSSVDITHSGLIVALEELRRQKTLEAMNYSDDRTFPPLPTMPDLGIVRSTARRVLIISKKKDWHDYLVSIFKSEKFVPIPAEDLNAGFAQYSTLSNCAIVLDATDLSVEEMDELKAMKKRYPSMYLLAIVGQNCEYINTIFSFAQDVFEVPASDMGIVRSLQRFFHRAS